MNKFNHYLHNHFNHIIQIAGRDYVLGLFTPMDPYSGYLEEGAFGFYVFGKTNDKLCFKAIIKDKFVEQLPQQTRFTYMCETLTVLFNEAETAHRERKQIKRFIPFYAKRSKNYKTESK